jgi:hypothetical protein
MRPVLRSIGLEAAAAALILLCLSTCSEAEDAAQAAARPSGIRGVATVGPILPVQPGGVPNRRPLPGAIITIQPASGGPEIARTRADGRGRFQLLLRPGSYLLVPLPPRPGQQFPFGKPRTVIVWPGRFTVIEVIYDSGIR